MAGIQKRKLADMLGPPWSEDDLELFYQAFRKHGKDWKKVSGSIHKRTVEMVEALYYTNKAYLSLPDGAASAAGLIAMMTDHYNLLDESQSQDEYTSDELGVSDERSHLVEPSKMKKGVSSLGMETSSIRSNGFSGPTGYGGPSPAKKPRTNRSRTVGKRTPRFPIGCAAERTTKTNKVSLSNLNNKAEDKVEEDSDSEVAAARTLVSNRIASPSISHTPSRRSLRQSTVHQNGDKKESLLRTESDASVKPSASTSRMDAQADASQESEEQEFDEPTKESSSTVGDGKGGRDGKASALGEAKSRWKKPLSKKLKLHNLDDMYEPAIHLKNRKDDGKELVEDPDRQSDEAEEADEVSKQGASGQRRRRPVSAPQRPKKRSRQLFSGDSNSGLDALATLAASSLSGLGLEGLELDEILNVVADAAAAMDDKAEDADHKSLKQPSPKKRELKRDSKLHQSEGKHESENDKMERAEGEKVEKADEGESALEDVQPSTSPLDSRKRKRKPSSDKVAKVKTPGLEEDAAIVLKPRSKLKRPQGTKILSSRQGQRLMKQHLETAVEGGGPASHSIANMGGDQAMEIDESSLPLKLRSKKKGVPEKFHAERVVFPTASSSGGPASHKEPVKREPACCTHATPELGPASAKARIIHCLCPKVRRWCMCEWFYSAIDLPWFARNEFVEYLNHAGLGHVPRLTRVEWGVIRGSLGKPRRLSKRFLQEEREKLDVYRESVRTHYHELRTGVRDGLPADLARPLTVGQKVIARHPTTFEIHDGSILTVDRCKCRVQFDRPELGVELVMDIDAMPIHPYDNMPEVMRRRRVVVDGVDRTLSEDPKLDLKRVWTGSGGVGGAARAALNERLERRFNILSQRFLNDLSKRAQADSLDSVREAREVTNRAVREAKEVTTKAAASAQRVGSHQSYSVVQSQARDADVRALADLSRALDKKEALVVELRHMNDEANSSDGLKTSDAFQRQYATVVLQLKEANKQVFTNALNHKTGFPALALHLSNLPVANLLRRFGYIQVANALLHLRQRNKYQDNAVPPWYRLSPQGYFLLGSPDGADTSELGPFDPAPALAEMTVLARNHARLMVTTAVKAMDGLKEGDDALQKLGSALEALPKEGGLSNQSPSHSVPVNDEGGTPLPGGSTPVTQPGSQVQSSPSIVREENPEPDLETVASSVRMSQPPNDGGLSVSPNTFEAAAHDLVQHLHQAACLTNGNNEGVFLSDLMTSCVATLFMLQTLSERPFSTSDVNQILDSALMTLRPKSAQNHCVYKEIEQQLAIVKQQITAHIPVPSSMPL